MSKVRIKGFDEHVVVPITIELADNEEVKFRVKYLRMDRKQGDKIFKEARERAEEARQLEVDKITSDDPKEQKRIARKIESLNKESLELIKERIVGWDDLPDVDGEEIPYSEEVLDMLLGHAAYQKELDQGMWNATGERLKN